MGGRGEIGRRCRLKIGFQWSAGSSPAVRTIGLALLAATLAACNPRPDSGEVVVSVIGGPPALVDATRGPVPPSARALIDATAQGLVRFDAAGQIEAGLAERWTVVDGGMTYIFRLRPAAWADGEPVTAEQVAAILRRLIGERSRDALAPFLTAVDDVVVMTPQVIEVRLKRPRPDLLKLFAQPELGLLRPHPASGTGPFRVVGQQGVAWRLRPLVDPRRVDLDEPAARRPEDDVLMIGERAAVAIARFATHRSDLVGGGSFTDWPLLATNADVAPANIRIDPAAGLFGLAIVSRDGFLAEPQHRAAIAEAIDAGAVTAAVNPAWAPVDAILPAGTDSTAAPAQPSWAPLSLDDRIAEAKAQVAAWQGGPITLRLALLEGPGATLVSGAIAATLRRIGITIVRVGLHDAADLRLIDEVAPYDSARWYLATACQLCGDTVQAALDAARDAPTLAGRAERIAAADRALADDAAFIPLARPLRWSLVALRLRQWQTNVRAWHPLNRLRSDAM